MRTQKKTAPFGWPDWYYRSRHPWKRSDDAVLYQAELQHSDVPEQVTRQAIADLGHLDVLVNNTGLTKHNSLFTTEVELMDFVYGLDFRAPILCAKQVVLHMRENGIRSIINITSTRAFRSYPEEAPYAAAKAGLTRATESMAIELASYITETTLKIDGGLILPGNEFMVVYASAIYPNSLPGL